MWIGVVVLIVSIHLTTASVTTPEFRWAQRKDRLLLTIDVQNCTNEVISFEDDGKFSFSGQGFPHDVAPVHSYLLTLQFLKPINATDSSCAVGARDIQCTIMKKTKEKYWKRLLKTKEKLPSMTIDWSKWLDEEKDGVRWNDMADRPWEWWKHEGEEEEETAVDEDEEEEDTKKKKKKKKKEKSK